MLRFRDKYQRAKPNADATARQTRVRLWLLVLALGLVLIAMRRIQLPQTAQKLGQLFGTGSGQHDNPQMEPAIDIKTTSAAHRRATVGEQPTGQNPQQVAEVDATDDRVISDSQDTSDTKPTRTEAIDDKLLSDIEDNTSFRPKEQAAWFALFGRLQHLSASELSSQSVGTLSYAQLLQQPEVYRGRVVTLDGTVVREDEQHVPENSLGMKTYHRLWIQPAGGGQWPFVVYCLRLPEQFPRGDGLRAPVVVNGFFFKNWSYAYDDGFGLAPIVLAADVAWKQTVPAQKKQVAPVGWEQLVGGGIAAAIIALVVLLIAWRQTRRQPRTPTLQSEETSVREAMRRLSESELDA